MYIDLQRLSYNVSYNINKLFTTVTTNMSVTVETCCVSS